MANPVTVVESGGVPVVDATPSGTPASNPSTVGVPVTPAENARPVTIVASGAPPVVFISDDGTEYLPGGGLSSQIQLTAATIQEGSAEDTLVGVLSVANGSGSYTFTFVDDDDLDGLFKIDGDELQAGASATDYETSTSHNVEIEADNGVDDPITRGFTITVANVLEVTLNALTLDNADIVTGSAEDTLVGALQSLTSGSSLDLTDTAGGRFKLTGTNIVAGATATDFETDTSHDITVRETHADGSNSPRDSVIAITVTSPGDFAPTYHIYGF